MELLLANGADVHQTSDWQVKSKRIYSPPIQKEPLRAPIHAAVIGWKSTNNLACQKVLRLLLNAGTDIEVKDAHGDTPLLSLFSRRSSPDIVAVKCLLQAGANVLAVAKNGDSVIHSYLSCPHDIQILKLLFKYGAQPNLLGHEGNTIIHTALENSYRTAKSENMASIVRFLLEMGARCDVKNKLALSAIEVAAGKLHCSLGTFTLLLQACSDVDTLKRCIWKLNVCNSKDGAVKYIRALQRLGVSLEDRDSNSGTVLLASTEWKDLFDAFVECGADLNAIDSKGRGVLRHYLSSGRQNITGESLQRLVDMVDMGLDPTQVSNNPMPLHNSPVDADMATRSIMMGIICFI